jgi:ABC-type sugar transport system ATPase subunit
MTKSGSVAGALEVVSSQPADRPLPFLAAPTATSGAGRALALTKVLLMDEPLSNLDARLREEVRTNQAGKSSITVLYVTHDQVEAMALADRIAVMSAGKILQIGASRDLYHFPLNRSVGEFLGSMNEFEGALQSDGSVKIALGILNCAVPNGTVNELIVAIRPEDVSLSREPSGLTNEFPAQLVSQLFLEDITLYPLCQRKNLLGKTAGTADQQLESKQLYLRAASREKN